MNLEAKKTITFNIHRASFDFNLFLRNSEKAIVRTNDIRKILRNVGLTGKK